MSVRAIGSRRRESESEREASRALGTALGSRVDDCWRICEARLETGGILDVGTPAFRARRRETQRRGLLLFSRWLLTGEVSNPGERTWLGELGELAARCDVSITHMTRGYLMFRDVVTELIAEESRAQDTPSGLLEHVHRVNAATCDSSVLWMTQTYDRQKQREAVEAERLHRELAASEHRFRGLFDSIACGIAVVGPDGVITACNDAAGEMLEFPREKLVGSSVYEVGSSYKDEGGSDLPQVPAAQAVATGEAVRGRIVKHDFGDGRPHRWHQVDAIPVFSTGGELLEVVATFTDVTAVKQAEGLRAESDAKNRFLATMSHELRTPLNSILGFAQLLLANGGEPADPRQLRYIGNIETSGKHLLALISDILELSQVMAGELELNLADIEVSGTIAAVAREFEPMLEDEHVSLHVDLDQPLLARVDPARFRQVIVNLLANAVKFTAAGSVTVRAVQAPGAIEVRIVDTGIGIPAAEMGRVLDEFTQVEGGADRTYDGTGLGLPLSKRLVELMGGTLALQSTIGRGTTAVVRVPVPR